MIDYEYIVETQELLLVGVMTCLDSDALAKRTSRPGCSAEAGI